jgi:hypothetical protein
MYREINLPLITEKIINECLDEISIDIDRDYIRTFILSGQSQILTLINQDYDILENEDDETGLML